MIRDKMRKSTKILLSMIAILFCALSVYKFYPFGTTEYDVEGMIDKLDIPKYSNVVEVNDDRIVISSFRSVFILDKEMKDLFVNYEKYSCSDNTLYYDGGANITIEDYEIDSWGILNKVILKYKRGRRIPAGCTREA